MSVSSANVASSYQSGGTFAAVSENPLPPTSETVTELSTDRTGMDAHTNMFITIHRAFSCRCYSTIWY